MDRFITNTTGDIRAPYGDGPDNTMTYERPTLETYGRVESLTEIVKDGSPAPE